MHKVVVIKAATQPSFASTTVMAFLSAKNTTSLSIPEQLSTNTLGVGGGIFSDLFGDGDRLTGAGTKVAQAECRLVARSAVVDRDFAGGRR